MEYSTAVDCTLRRMGHVVIGMGQSVAESSKPAERCKEDVSACDGYATIVAWCDGHIPGPKLKAPHPSSLTEKAMAEAQLTGKPVQVVYSPFCRSTC